jgi:enoyl-[acyl-carrier protein] reductase II
MAAIDVIIGEGASSFIAGLGVPGPVIERCHKAGLKVVSMCGKVEHAKRAEEAGCDVVVAQGTEAGGHTGLVAGIALIPQIVDAVKIPVLAAGSIVDGRGLAAALSFGAQGIWMGTRFIASEEARASGAYKRAIVQSGSADTSITRCYSGKPMRVIRNPYVEDWDRRPQDLKKFPDQMILSAQEGLLGFAFEEHTDPERTCMPAGQGVGGIHEVLPVAEIIRRTMQEAEETIARLSALRETAPAAARAAR